VYRWKFEGLCRRTHMKVRALQTARASRKYQQIHLTVQGLLQAPAYRRSLGDFLLPQRLLRQLQRPGAKGSSSRRYPGVPRPTHSPCMPTPQLPQRLVLLESGGCRRTPRQPSTHNGEAARRAPRLVQPPVQRKDRQTHHHKPQPLQQRRPQPPPAVLHRNTVQSCRLHWSTVRPCRRCMQMFCLCGRF